MNDGSREVVGRLRAVAVGAHPCADEPVSPGEIIDSAIAAADLIERLSKELQEFNNILRAVERERDELRERIEKAPKGPCGIIKAVSGSLHAGVIAEVPGRDLDGQRVAIVPIQDET